MARIFAILLIFTVLFLGSINSVQAFDGERKGFIIGLGVGTGFTSISDWEEYKFGFQTDFKIGFAPSNSLTIYYNSKVSW